MVTFGYAKKTYYTNDGKPMIQVRIPSVHGPYKLSDYKGQQVKNYVPDSSLPSYQSLLLPYLPNDGEVVALAAMDKGNSEFLVIGLTGGSYQEGVKSL